MFDIRSYKGGGSEGLLDLSSINRGPENIGQESGILGENCVYPNWRPAEKLSDLHHSIPPLSHSS
jgi:hypothetical protein